ncbi:MAG: glycosyltransferase family 87 protein [Candidatus Dormibacteria bacterium]
MPRLHLRMTAALAPALNVSRVGRVLVTVASTAAVAGAVWQFVVLPLLGRFPGAFEDFAMYQQGITALGHGQSPYLGFSGSTIVMTGFDYPPFATTLLRPLAFLAPSWQPIVWLWLSLAALTAGAVIVARELLPPAWPRARVGLLVALTFPPATYNLWHGQVNTMIFLLLALAAREWMRGRLARFAVIVGIAAGIKVVPAILLVLLLRRGGGRALAAGVGTASATVLAGLVTLGPAVTTEWLTAVFPVLSRDNGWIYNQSWNGVANRLLDHSVMTVQSPSVATHALTLGLTVATLAGVLYAVRGHAASPPERGAQMGIVVCAMVLTGSVDWYPVGVHLLISLAAAAGLAVQRRRAAASLWVACTALFAGMFGFGVGLVAVLDNARIGAIVAGPGGWLFLQLTSLPALLTVALMVALSRALHLRSPGPTPTQRRWVRAVSRSASRRASRSAMA